MESTKKISKNRKALYLILLVIFDFALFYLPLYTDIPWIPNSAYNFMDSISEPAVLITIVGIIAFLLHSAKRTGEISDQNYSVAMRSSGSGKLHPVLQFLIIFILTAAGFGLVWVGLVIHALSHQTY